MLHRLPEASEIFIPDVGGEASAFNAESARLQRAVGVDPRECLKLGIVPGDAETEFVVQFSYLQLGIWISPAAGFWREHDEECHDQRIRELHPNGAKTAIYGATVGKERLLQGEVKSAERMGKNLDTFLDQRSTYMDYFKLVEDCGVDLRTATDYPIQVQHAIDLEQVA